MLRSARKKEKDPEGRMPLGDHLRELRNRLAKAVLGIIVVTVVAAFFYKDIIGFFTNPIFRAVGCHADFDDLTQRDSGTCARIVLNGLLTPFTLALKVSLMVGIIGASPIWLYQLWAFVAPGLHQHEKKYARAFVGTGVPLFLGGAFFAYKTLPTMATVLLGFSPGDLDNLLPLDELVDIVTRMVVIFGLSFELPLLLVMLNLTGVLSGRRMLGWWRAMIMCITIFSAIVTPSTDPITMLALAGPIWLLYFAATGFSLFNDRRRARAAAAGPADDEASELDLTPEAIDPAEPVSTSRGQGELPPGDDHRVNGYDDVT